MPTRPTILILSFSPISTDARVLKQIAVARELGDVVTCGYGPAADGVLEHVRIPDDLTIYPLSPKLLVLRLGRLALHRAPAIAWVRRSLTGRSFDAVISNDIEALPTALRLSSRAGVVADLHEFSPGQHSNSAGWVRWVRPITLDIVRHDLPRAEFVTTVSPIIAQEFTRLSGASVDVVINAAPFADLEPTPVHQPLRLVHSGVCLRNRRLDLLIEGVARSGRPVVFDLFLMPNDPVYLGELRALASTVPGVTVHDPVAYRDLVARLNEYDLGVFVLPPTTRNYEWALPNKFFDFVQARLGIVVGPTIEMAHLVHEHGLGVVIGDFSAESLGVAIQTITDEQVAGFKAASDAAAVELSAERAVGPWRDALASILGAERA